MRKLPGSDIYKKKITLAYRIVLRQDTKSNWDSNNPILLSGEFGYETDTNKVKFGNGVSKWDELSYFQPGPTGPDGATGDISWLSAPATAGSTGSTGQLAYDDNYLYLATGTNTWARVSLTTSW